MSENEDSVTKDALSDSAEASTEILPILPDTLSQDERYFLLLATAIRRCKTYRPKFGQGRGNGLTAQEFIALYAADPLYHWFGIDSPLMYAAHRAAGGMTSVYRQVGIGCEWLFLQMLQDCLGLTREQATWNYTVDTDGGRARRLTLDGRITLQDVPDTTARQRMHTWLQQASQSIGLPPQTFANLNGVVFEARQGYKSKDSKRQIADMTNAVNAYTHLYMPVLLLFSMQIDGDVAQRYRRGRWLLLTGTTQGTITDSTYIFCRDVLGYDLAAFFQQHSVRLRAEIEDVLQTLLNT